MKIAIIGNGNVGSGLANVLSKTQHQVGTFGRADDVANAVNEADIVILATPYGAAAEIVEQADFTGKIVIDVSNPVTEDFSSLQLGTTTSAAEAIAALVPGAFVVKAFNTIFAQHYAGDLKLDGQPLQTFVAADDETARDTVKMLAAEAGFEPVDAGPLATARQLEPLGFLNIQFGYVLEKGTEIAPRWQFSA
ncbi:F420-dependent NADP oxidoreductase [Roseovarius spongiae]|uniref:F420-dependent NADP oxidoreductase n=1 Tax=Roseovarius spongiae TaxID=2320272 RepID=A0A3A8B3M0_9RHOB|nr:NAD(P)-binding domain-containing protein [Roseovarius spongiae]RKF12344.1 F420-dependent NADP oxidoreductase [Roseovarius spongiae]